MPKGILNRASISIFVDGVEVFDSLGAVLANPIPPANNHN
jgi:hypothetical protein